MTRLLHSKIIWGTLLGAAAGYPIAPFMFESARDMAWWECVEFHSMNIVGGAMLGLLVGLVLDYSLRPRT